MVGVEVTCAADRDTLKNTLLNVGAISNEAEWLYEALPVHATVLGENVVQILGTTLKAIPQSEDPPSCDVNIFGKETVSEDLQKFRKIATKVKGLDVKIKPQHIEDFAAISDMQPITAFKRVEYLRMDTSQLTFGSREMFHDAAVRGTRSVLASLAELKKLHLHQGPRELAQRKQTGIVDCLALLPKLNDVEFESCSSVVDQGWSKLAFQVCDPDSCQYHFAANMTRLVLGDTHETHLHALSRVLQHMTQLEELRISSPKDGAARFEAVQACSFLSALTRLSVLELSVNVHCQETDLHHLGALIGDLEWLVTLKLEVLKPDGPFRGDILGPYFTTIRRLDCVWYCHQPVTQEVQESGSVKPEGAEVNAVWSQEGATRNSGTNNPLSNPLHMLAFACSEQQMPPPNDQRPEVHDVPKSIIPGFQASEASPDPIIGPDHSTAWQEIPVHIDAGPSTSKGLPPVLETGASNSLGSGSKLSASTHAREFKVPPCIVLDEGHCPRAEPSAHEEVKAASPDLIVGYKRQRSSPLSSPDKPRSGLRFVTFAADCDDATPSRGMCTRNSSASIDSPRRSPRNKNAALGTGDAETHHR